MEVSRRSCMKMGAIAAASICVIGLSGCSTSLNKIMTVQGYQYEYQNVLLKELEASFASSVPTGCAFGFDAVSFVSEEKRNAYLDYYADVAAGEEGRYSQNRGVEWETNPKTQMVSAKTSFIGPR